MEAATTEAGTAGQEQRGPPARHTHAMPAT